MTVISIVLILVIIDTAVHVNHPLMIRLITGGCVSLLLLYGTYCIYRRNGFGYYSTIGFVSLLLLLRVATWNSSINGPYKLNNDAQRGGRFVAEYSSSYREPPCYSIFYISKKIRPNFGSL